MYAADSIYKEWKRFKRHFCVALVMVTIDGLINYPLGKNIIIPLLMYISLFLLYVVLHMYYRKSHKEKKGHSWLIRWLGVFFLDGLITMTLCLDIPAIIFAIYRRQVPYVYIIDPTYECIINMITFIIVLLYCIHLKINFEVDHTLLYIWFFIMYFGSVLFHFSPEKLKLAVLQAIYSSNTPDFLKTEVNYYKPAIKEAVLAFIILDSSNILPMLKDYLKNR